MSGGILVELVEWAPRQLEKTGLQRILVANDHQLARGDVFGSGNGLFDALGELVERLACEIELGGVSQIGLELTRALNREVIPTEPGPTLVIPLDQRVIYLDCQPVRVGDDLGGAEGPFQGRGPDRGEGSVGEVKSGQLCLPLTADRETEAGESPINQALGVVYLSVTH